MKLTYDPEADALYIALSEGPVAKTSDVEEGVILDYGADGRLVGVEILRASLRTRETPSVEYVVTRTPVKDVAAS
jgi:uncharacterized protein YuzE